ncbi:hypothetical protein WJX73_005507 [Symbiochloris irregularis]|uniref:Uncharacterized protein n=1 Tax=Symbiochloris irregularis TaxID=706552 RepID=A0AAW1NNN8_9CHLO
MNEQEYLRGMWKPLRRQCAITSLEQLNAHAYPYESDCNPAVHLCTPDLDHCATKVLKIAQYQWIPQKCNFDPFDASRLSAHVGRRRVLFVGDSIQVQQFASLRHLMRHTINADKDPLPQDWHLFLTMDGGRFMVEGAQFLVGPEMGEPGNPEVDVRPNSS